MNQRLYDEAIDMFARINVHLTTEELDLAVADLELVSDESEFRDEDYEDVIAEWLRRLGGVINVKKYLNTLKMQIKAVRARDRAEQLKAKLDRRRYP